MREMRHGSSYEVADEEGFEDERDEEEELDEESEDMGISSLYDDDDYDDPSHEYDE